MHVADFNADAGVVTIRESKAGKPRHVVLTNEGQRLLARLTAGKLGTDPVFVRADGGMWGKSYELRPMLEASTRAKIKPAISFHVLRHTHCSTLAIALATSPTLVDFSSIACTFSSCRAPG